MRISDWSSDVCSSDLLMAASVEAAQTVIQTESPNHAVVDLKLGSSSGLSVVQALHAHDATMLIVVLTGFASLATAVEAIKPGACTFLVKPENTDDVAAALSEQDGTVAAIGHSKGRESVLEEV